MPSASEVKLGNWFLYKPKNQYCTIVSLGPTFVVEGINGDWRCWPEQLQAINVSSDIFSLAGFKSNGGVYRKTINQTIELTIRYGINHVPCLDGRDGKQHNVMFVHRLQNAYYEITGESLVPNLYGVHPT